MRVREAPSDQGLAAAQRGTPHPPVPCGVSRGGGQVFASAACVCSAGP